MSRKRRTGSVRAWLIVGVAAVLTFGSVVLGAEDEVDRLIERMASRDSAARTRAEETLCDLLHREVTIYARKKAAREEGERKKALNALRKHASALAQACSSENAFRSAAASRIRNSLVRRTRAALVLASMRGGGRRMITAVDTRGQIAWALTAGTGEDDWPRFSPSGDRICFVRREEGSRLYVMNADGDRERRVVDDTQAGGGAAWSPDGRSLCYVSRKVGNSDLCVVPASGGKSRRLTFRPADEFHPRWSPDGSKIAFETYRDGDREVFVIDAAGGEPKNLSRRPGRDRDPRWSPDGSSIAFTSGGGGASDIRVVRSDGSGTICVLRSEHTDHQPSWSPDGRMLAYSSFRRTKKGETNVLCVVDAKTAREIHTTRPEQNNWAWRSEWFSPTEVAFERTRELCPRHERKICVVDIRSGVERVVYSEQGISCPPRFSLAPVRLDELRELFLK